MANILSNKVIGCTSSSLLTSSTCRAGKRSCLNTTRSQNRSVRIACSTAATPANGTVLQPIHKTITAFAPATVANLGPGFDWLGCAVEAGGDIVVATASPASAPGSISIEAIVGDGGRLKLDPAENCIGVAATETIKLMGGSSCGVALKLYKGLPLGSGMGSSAASAAAAAWAVNGLFGSPVSKQQLILAGLAAEAAVSGYHADNVGPSILGGFVLIRSCTPLDLLQLPFQGDLWFVLVNPQFEAPTKKMRAALPQQVPFKSLIANSVQGGSLVAGILQGNAQLLGDSLNSEVVVEPARAPLIPGMLAVKQAANAAGAYGCTISGAGPTAVAIVSDYETGQKVAAAMVKAFETHGGLGVNTSQVVRLDPVGAKFL